MKQIQVKVPVTNEVAYNLYVEGILTTLPEYTQNGNSVFRELSLKADSVFCLFYYFSSFRRAYICTSWNEKDITTPVMLPGINEKLTVIYSARGKRFDHLKRCLYLLKQKNQKNFFLFPLIFWYRLAGILQYKGALKRNVIRLYNNFLELEK